MSKTINFPKKYKNPVGMRKTYRFDEFPTPENVAIMTVDGDAFDSVGIKQDDRLLLDLDAGLESGGLYVFGLNEKLMLRYVEVLDKGMLRLYTPSEKFPPIKEHRMSVDILGRSFRLERDLD